MAIYNMFQVWSLGYAAWFSTWFVMLYPLHVGCFSGWYGSGRVIAGVHGAIGSPVGHLCIWFLLRGLSLSGLLEWLAFSDEIG
jgi:hypothetical protein